MNFDVMRRKLLQKAVQGQLVPQLDDEPAVEQVGTPPEEVPFAIPEKWKWCTLGSIAVYGGRNQVAAEDIPSGSWILDLEDIEKNTGRLLKKKRDVSVSSNKTSFKKGDVLYGKLRPYLNKAIIADEDGFCTTEIVAIPEDSFLIPLSPEYLKLCLMSPFFVEYATRCSYGVKMPRLGTKDAKAAAIPFPPIQEQNRIVAKLKNTLGLIDKAEKAYSELAGPLSDRFRSLCLERAIKGELVPQLNDEPAVEQIGATPKEIPFSIPEKWKWVNLGDAFQLKAGKFISASEIKKEGPYPCYGGNGIRGYVDHYNKEGKFPLIGRQGALCGNINVANGRFYATEHAVIADGGNLIDPDCAAYFLQHLNLNQYATSTAQPGLSVKRISGTPFPLAPLKEQRRIVEKLNVLFKDLDRLTG